MLGTLANNGGTTQTIALLVGSPAIDKGSNALAVDPTLGQPLTTDQRGIGFSRVVNNTVDIGAFEFQTTATAATHFVVAVQPPSHVTVGSGFGLIVSAVDQSGVVATTFNGTVTVALVNNPGGATLGGTLSVTAQSGVATFSGLTLNQVGIGYTLQVSGTGLTPATTNPFNVPPVGGNTFTVNSLGDTGTGLGLSGDLRYVITQTNSEPGSIIDFGVAGTIQLASALPDLEADVTINGPGAANLTVARSSAAATPEFGIFTIDTNANVQITGLTITGGSTAIGGAIANNGTLTLNTCIITGNTASVVAGGIANNGTLTLNTSTISGNEDAGYYGGGGIDNEGTMTITNSTFASNSSQQRWRHRELRHDDHHDLHLRRQLSQRRWRHQQQGGHVMTITNSTFASNSANSGGGIENVFGMIGITNSTISGNGGGGIPCRVGHSDPRQHDRRPQHWWRRAGRRPRRQRLFLRRVQPHRHHQRL